MRTLHQSKCYESAKKAKKAAQNTARKTKQKQTATLNKLRKKTWGF